jgi:hypothetical protein
MYIIADENGIKITPAGKSWRLIHNSGIIVALFEGEHAMETGGDTEVFVAETKAECEAEAEKLGLFKPQHIK